MTALRCSPEAPVAVLSLQSHGDRSFLDDRSLALLSGSLRERGIENDLVVAVLVPDEPSAASADGRGGGEVERRLAAAIASL